MDSTIEFDLQTRTYYFDCPHCGGKIEVPERDICCRIFRHAAGLGPHDPKDVCEAHEKKSHFRRGGAVGSKDGCAKPFRFDGRKVEKCDYI
jgi:hypothetical protein